MPIVSGDTYTTPAKTMLVTSQNVVVGLLIDKQKEMNFPFFASFPVGFAVYVVVVQMHTQC